MGAENKYVDLLGFKIFSGSKKEAIEKIFKMKKVHIVSGNPEVLYRGLNNKVLLKNFKSKKSFIIPDGVGVQISAKILKENIKEKIAGIDLMEEILKECEVRNEKIYLLGATAENLKSCVKNILIKYPKINIVGYRDGFFDIDNPEEVLKDLKEKKPKALFVAMGCPKQETFIVKYMGELDINIFMGVGGSFDVIGKSVKRAPKWMVNNGLEWSYRVIREPWRIKRLDIIPKFLLLVIKDRRKKYKKKYKMVTTIIK